MRDLERIDKICNRLAKVWKYYPDWRLGQLLQNMTGSRDLYYLEDDEIIARLEGYLYMDLCPND